MVESEIRKSFQVRFVKIIRILTKHKKRKPNIQAYAYTV